MKTLNELFYFLLKEDVTMFQNDDGDEKEEFEQEKFDIKKLKSIQNHQELKMYIERTLGRAFAGGDFRHAWDLGNGKILKMIIDPAKNYQNRNEVRNTRCLGTSYAPKIFAFDKDNFFWIISEKVQLVDEWTFYDLFSDFVGISFTNEGNIDNFVEYCVAKLKNQTSREKELEEDNPEFNQYFKEFYGENEWLTGLLNHLKTCNVTSSDFHTDNWGLREETGELLLIDLGF